MDQHQISNKNGNNSQGDSLAEGDLGLSAALGFTNTTTNNSNNNNNNESLENSNSDKDENDTVDDSFENNINKICYNCDTISNEANSTPKGLLCNDCYNYWKQTGLMKPDNYNWSATSGKLVLAPNNSNNNSNKVTANLSKQNGYGIKNNNSTHNRYITMNNSNNQDQINSNNNNSAKEARNYFKSLRKPPKGIYLNYEELVNLAETDSTQIFDNLNRQLLKLKKEIQFNKQNQSDLLNELANMENFKGTIDNCLLQIDQNQTITKEWTEREVMLALQGYQTYGDNFEAISQVIGSKTESNVRTFYNYHKEHFNLNKSAQVTNPVLLLLLTTFYIFL
jgi:hypothetical protein